MGELTDPIQKYTERKRKEQEQRKNPKALTPAEKIIDFANQAKDWINDISAVEASQILEVWTPILEKLAEEIDHVDGENQQTQETTETVDDSADSTDDSTTESTATTES